MNYVWAFLLGVASLLLLFSVVWTALHSWLFAGCLALVLGLFAVVGVWGSQSERL